MRFFVCLLSPDGRAISDTIKRGYESLAHARGLEMCWHSSTDASVLTAWDDPGGDPLVARVGSHLAVGSVRLDNRAEVAKWAGIPQTDLTDLELTARSVVLHGDRYVPELLGDFAFVVWSAAMRTGLAVGDALGVRKLYYSRRDGLICFSSRAEGLAFDQRYEIQYLAELVSNCVPTAGLTPYAGVQRVPAGTSTTFQGNGAFVMRRYWSLQDFVHEPLRNMPEREAPQMCRELLAKSVRYRVASNGDTWAQLSGGLDSSSIVSMTQWLAAQGTIPRGLAGTVTYVDRQGTEADEREYSEAIVARWPVPNETIVDPPFWSDGHAAPPHLDEPRDSLAFYPRERRLCNIVRRGGGRVLLTGFGSDELFTGTTYFFADWVSQGRILAAMREMARWAAIGRVSFWQFAYGNALLPLLPAVCRRPRASDQGAVLPWISPGAVRTYGLRARLLTVAGNTGPVGRKYRDAIANNLTDLTSRLDAGLIGDALDVRYPFLYRPLVEFALRVPPELCARPHARKWVLREAMRGILPESVRTRVGKGAPTDVLVGSLISQRALLEPLIDNSVLAELGVVDTGPLRAAFDAVSTSVHSGADLCADVQNTLMTEAWLQIRSGRWPVGLS